MRPTFKSRWRSIPPSWWVETATPEVALAALGARGLSVDSTKDLSYVGADQWRIQLGGATTGDAVVDAGLALRADPRIAFVGHAYRTETGDKLALINRLIVRFSGGVTQKAIDRLVDSLGMRVIRAARPDSAKPSYWLAYPRGVDPLTFAAALHRHPLVRWAEPDRLVPLHFDGYVPSDPLYAQQYYLKNAITRNGVPVDDYVEDVWQTTMGSPDITVAVIGMGIDANQPDLYGRRKEGPCFEGWDSIFVEPVWTGSAWQPWGQFCAPGHPCGDYEPKSANHDTGVAGIIAALHNGNGVVGIAPNVKLVSARIGVPGGPEPDPAGVADAINWAWSTCGADVVNGSWHLDDWSTEVAAAIDAGTTNGRPPSGLGTVFVFSGGNAIPGRSQGNLMPVHFPASISSTIAVGAINRWGGVADYDPYGGWPICPPGAFCIPPAPGAKFGPDLVAPSGHTLAPYCPATGAVWVPLGDSIKWTSPGHRPPPHRSRLRRPSCSPGNQV